MNIRNIILLIILILPLFIKCSISKKIDEKQKIYNIVLNHLYPKNEQVILRDSTLTIDQNTHTWFYFELDKEYPESIANSLEEDFLNKNKIPSSFQITNVDVRYLPLEDYFKLVKNDKQNSFAVISEKFHGAKEYSAFSEITFSKEKNLALLKVLRLTSNFEEYDHFFILKKNEGNWEIYKDQKLLNQSR